MQEYLWIQYPVHMWVQFMSPTIRGRGAANLSLKDREYGRDRSGLSESASWAFKILTSHETEGIDRGDYEWWS